MKLKLGILRYFTSVEKIVFRSLHCNISAIPLGTIATYKHLTSLTINNCAFLQLNGAHYNKCLDHDSMKIIARMTRLQKLDLDLQMISESDYVALRALTRLTQLRVRSKFENNNAIPKGLKKLS